MGLAGQMEVVLPKLRVATFRDASIARTWRWKT